jgi:hypothetical protein
MAKRNNGRLGWRKLRSYGVLGEKRIEPASPPSLIAKASVVPFNPPKKVRPMTGLEPRLQPFPSCKSVISYRRHFCWAPTEGWGMKQDEVCEACQIKQAEWLAESRRA